MRRSAIAAAAAAAAVAVPGVASAAPASNGATVSLAAGHTQCTSADLVINAAGFAAGRRQVTVIVQAKGAGNVGSVVVPLTGGAGSVDLGVVALPDGRYQLRTSKAVPGRQVFPTFSFTVVSAC